MPVAQSSHLQSYDYDADSQTLTIQFQNGAAYQYAGVPPNVAEEFKRNGGAGSFFHANIRDRYPAAKLSGPSSQKQ